MLRSAYGMSRPSFICLSVTLLHPRQRLELFGNIFAPPNRPGTLTVCIKILRKNSKGYIQGGMKNWRFLTSISLYFENSTRNDHSYNGR